MEERNAQAQRMQFQQGSQHPQQVFFKNPQGNDTTSISSIQPYIWLFTTIHSMIASVFAINLNKSVYYHKTISIFMGFGVVSELL